MAVPQDESLGLLDSGLFRQAFEQAADSICIADARAPDYPIVYVNPGYERLTGYAPDEVIGHNCRLLQGGDREQQARETVRDALRTAQGCVTVFRNYRADGSAFWCEVSISPLRDDSGVISHFLGLQRDISHYVHKNQELQACHQGLRDSLGELSELALSDPLTGLRNRRQFDFVLEREWRICRREKAPLSLALIDVDDFKSFNDRYGHVSGDQCLARVAQTLVVRFQRGSDLVARIGGDEMVVLAPRQAPEKLVERLEDACAAVTALAIPHADVASGVVGISAGVAGWIPDTEEPKELLRAADGAMYSAKKNYRGGVGPAALK